MPDDPRPWHQTRRRAAGWLVALGAFFYLSYGAANWLAAQRGGVPVVAFGWETSIPFVAWTIVPYWSTNLLFALSFFLCRDRTELDSHARRLLTAQMVAVACFIAFPLQVGLTRPATIDGAFGFLFDALSSFDKPFNQAPSLHVAITVVLFDLYVRKLSRWAQAAFGLWSVLVVVSVLTTWQHRFIDIPTGLLLGVVCVWLWPLHGGNRLQASRLTRDRDRRALAARYGLGAAALAALAVAMQGWLLLMLWPAIALAAVSAAYLSLGPALFAKTPDGRIDRAVQLLLAPYLAAAWINSRLWTRHEPHRVEVARGVWLGRFPSSTDCRGMASIVDLTSELSRPACQARWISLPMLDLVAADAETLRSAAETIESARARGPVLVCCALGYGRSVAALAVWLVRYRRMDLRSALQRLRNRRPQLRLGGRQQLAVVEAIGVA